MEEAIINNNKISKIEEKGNIKKISNEISCERQERQKKKVQSFIKNLKKKVRVEFSRENVIK